MICCLVLLIHILTITEFHRISFRWQPDRAKLDIFLVFMYQVGYIPSFELLQPLVNDLVSFLVYLYLVLYLLSRENVGLCLKRR